MEIRKRKDTKPFTKFDIDLNRKKHENIFEKFDNVDAPVLPMDASVEVLQVNGEQIKLERFVVGANADTTCTSGDTTKEKIKSNPEVNGEPDKVGPKTTQNESSQLESTMEEENYEDLDTRKLHSELDIDDDGDMGWSPDVAYSAGIKKIQGETCQIKSDISGRNAYSCHSCNFETNLKELLTSHLLVHAFKPNVNSNALKKSMKFIRYKCTHCKAGYDRKNVLDEHLLRKHPEFIASVTSKIHQCPKCDYKTVKRNTFQYHSLQHLGVGKPKPHKCSHCDESFASYTSLNDHILRKHPSFAASIKCEIYKCEKCTFSTTINAKLEKHLLSHPGTPSSYILNVCVYCSKKFYGKQKMNDHVLKNHPNAVEVLDYKVLECEKCKYKTTIKSSLRSHMNKHSQNIDEVKKCVHCTATFKNTTTLNNHIIRMHPKFIDTITGKIHKCEKCEYKTSLSSAIRAHIISKHPEIVPISKFKTCLHCKAVFTAKPSLDDHIIKSHPHSASTVTSLIRECTICDYKTTRKDNFTKHLLTHSKENVK
ncbi:unnamed protein product [Acanthoscelides obtectus]|uniref:C2H2-type domain-containing protein n=1 Tax=Acanthoscelides obtectus TaxID=200917 RepID=A0A9P0PE76_ACAOB|nr:unnamed protein product [Acanthoscelides obtectus]CAK1677103.1 Zinc finger protein 711 [Acanthoscelides obtectus]